MVLLENVQTGLGKALVGRHAEEHATPRRLHRINHAEQHDHAHLRGLEAHISVQAVVSCMRLQDVQGMEEAMHSEHDHVELAQGR